MIDGLPPLREVIGRHALSPRKALGQNFLLDLNLTMKIAREAGPLEGFDVFEIGPGPGGLTRALLACGARRVIAIERDTRCIAALEEISAHYPGRVEIIEGDALKTNWQNLASQPSKIVANLPYNIATPLLTGWLGSDQWPPFFSSLTLMFQKEVAERICARPGDKAYGRLGVLCGWRAHTRMAFDISSRAFTPPPKVTSTVVSITPKDKIIACPVTTLEDVTRAAFGQRRKMLRSSLKSLGGKALLESAGINGDKRAEELDVDEFLKLATALQAMRT